MHFEAKVWISVGHAFWSKSGFLCPFGLLGEGRGGKRAARGFRTEMKKIVV